MLTSNSDAAAEQGERVDRVHVHFVVHESFESPGAYEDWARARGHEVTLTRLYAGETLPEGPEGIDLLVVMGGPQSPATSLEECPHFDALGEERLIRSCVDVGAAVVGVCLGSQLLGEAFGARFAHSPEREIGLFPIELTEAGKADALLADFGPGLPVGHWHGDMPGIAPGAEVLATSAGCPRQIVRYAPRVYGFQCHLEFTAASIRGIVDASTEELARYASCPFVEDAQTLLAHDYEPMNRVLWGFLDRLMG